MTAALYGPPPSDGWTIEDLDALPVDGVRRELIDGVLHVIPSPSPLHQSLALLLGGALIRTCPDHLYVSQANDVLLNPRRLFVPDVLVVSFEAAKESKGKFAARDVRLAVEIVSPSSQSMDRVMKPALYAKAGISFYWLVETAGGLCVTTYQLNPADEIFEPTATFTEDDVIKTDGPWPIEIPLKDIRPRLL